MITCPECDYEVKGECRRYPPPFPKVNETMGCGEGKPRGETDTVNVAVFGDGGKAVNANRTSVLSR